MIEILTIDVTILGVIVVEGPKESANMVSFDAEANSPYFVRKSLSGGMDAQTYIKADNGSVINITISARYVLEVKDYEDEECKIFVDNTGFIGGNSGHPYVITDCKTLNALNKHNLKVKGNWSSGNLTIHNYKPLTQVPDLSRKPATKQGKIEKFKYVANINGKVVKKRVLIYLYMIMTRMTKQRTIMYLFDV